MIQEVNRILHQDLYSEKNILSNLRNYNALFELVNEEEVDKTLVFKSSQIKEVAVKNRLKFLDSQSYKFEIPYEAVLKIEHLNLTQHKNLNGFKILSTSDFFKKEGITDSAALFAPTHLGNYYLIHQWGEDLKWNRKLLNWPLRNIENLFVSIVVATLIITLCLPTYLITLDRTATYWCGYRIGVFFHLLIFNLGVTTYIAFAFTKNLSSSIWNSDKDFI